MLGMKHEINRTSIARFFKLETSGHTVLSAIIRDGQLFGHRLEQNPDSGQVLLLGQHGKVPTALVFVETAVHELASLVCVFAADDTSKFHFTGGDHFDIDAG